MSDTRRDYLKDFQEPTDARAAPSDVAPPVGAGTRQREALKQALDIRKFEIDLYWKRAGYFWTFIAAAFAGYFVLQKDGEFASIYVTTCLGFLFSLAWYLVNRGSASWQQNWEKHVDLLEDEIMGPLYKTHIDRRSSKIRDFAGPYPFSPSRINTILALGVTFVWLVLIARTLWKWRLGVFEFPYSATAILLSAFTVAISIILVLKGRAKRSPDEPLTFERHTRQYF
jgi:hypothetical protein